MDALTLGDAGSRGQRCERYPLLLLLLDKESGESGGEEARGGGGGAGRGRGGYGVAEGACGDDGGGGAGGYRRFDHEGGRGGQRLARGAAALLGSWPRHLMVALVAALAVGFALLVLVVLSAWLAAPAARPRASRYCDGGACGQVSPDLDLDLDRGIDLRLQLDVALAPHHHAELDDVRDSAVPSALEVTVYSLKDTAAAPASELDPARLVVSAAVEHALDPADHSDLDPSPVTTSDTDYDSLLQFNDRFAEEPTQEDAVFESAVDFLLAADDHGIASPLVADKDSDRLPSSYSTILIQPESENHAENSILSTDVTSSSGSAIDLILQAAVNKVLETTINFVDDSNYDRDITSVELDLDTQGTRTANNTIDDSVNSNSRVPLESTDDSDILDDLLLLAARAERALESVFDHGVDSVSDTYIDRSLPSIDSINEIIPSRAENSDADSTKDYGMKLVYRSDDAIADSDSKRADDSSINFVPLPEIQNGIDSPMYTALNIDSRPALDLKHVADLALTPSFYPKEHSSSRISPKHSLISDLTTLSDPVLESVVDITVNLALKSSNPAHIEKDHTGYITRTHPDATVRTTTIKRPLHEEVSSTLTVPFLFGGVSLPHSRAKEISLSTLDSPWPNFIRRRQTPQNVPLTDLFTDSTPDRRRKTEKYQPSTQGSPSVILQPSSTSEIATNLIRSSNSFLDPKIVTVSVFPSTSVSRFSRFPGSYFTTNIAKLPSFVPISNFNSISEVDDVPNKMSQLLPSHSNDVFESTDSVILSLLSSIAKNIATDLKDVRPEVPLPSQFIYSSSGDILPFSVEKAKFPSEDSVSETIAQLIEGAHPLVDTDEERFERHNSRFSKEREQTGYKSARPFTLLTFSSSSDIPPKPFSQTLKSDVKNVLSPHESLEQACLCKNRNKNIANPRRFFYVPSIERTLGHFRMSDTHPEFPTLPITRTACPCQKCTSYLHGLPRGNHYPNSVLPGVHAQPFHLRDVSSRSPCTCGCMDSQEAFPWPSPETRPLPSLNITRPCQVEMVSVEEIGPRRCQRPDTTTADIFPTIVTQRPKTTQPQSAPHRKGERSWAWRRFMGHALPAAKTAAREQAAKEASVRSSSWPRPAIAEDVESFWELRASPWTAPSASTEEAAVKTAAARPERPVSFVVGDGDPLTREQVCALESAARFNPRSPVHVLVLSPHADAPADDDAAARPAHWPAPRDARSAAASALHAVLRAYHGAIQVVAVGEELFSRSPLQALWERARARLAASAEEDGDSDVEGEGETEGEARFGAALRLGARLLALWEFGGMALEPSLLSLRNASADDLHTKRYYTDAVRLDTKEALVLSVSEVCHPLVFELLRALAAVAAEGPAEGATQEALLRQAVTRALPEFCRGAPGGGGGGGGHAHASTAALEVGDDDGVLAVRVQCAPAAPVPDRLLCRDRPPPRPDACLWAPAASLDLETLERLCPVTAAAAAR